MKYGVNTMVWTTRMNREQEPLLSRIKEWGFDGVELFLSLNEPANIPEMRQILDRLGLDRTTCAVLPRDANLVSTDPDVRARGVAQIGVVRARLLEGQALRREVRLPCPR